MVNRPIHVHAQELLPLSISALSLALLVSSVLRATVLRLPKSTTMDGGSRQQWLLCYSLGYRRLLMLFSPPICHPSAVYLRA